MINREIVYERNVTGSFMRIAAPAEGGVDERLLLRRKLPGVLAVEKAYVNGGGQYWYNISGKQSLDTYCSVKEIRMDFVEQLIISVCSLLERMEWNLIRMDCLMLDPELVFISNASQDFVFTLYPGGTQKVEQEFQMLMEYLMKKVDHKDTEAVRAVYQIYEHTLEEGYQITDIRSLLFRDKSGLNQDEEWNRSVASGNGKQSMGKNNRANLKCEADRYEDAEQCLSEMHEKTVKNQGTEKAKIDFRKGIRTDRVHKTQNGTGIWRVMKAKLVAWGILQDSENPQSINNTKLVEEKRSKKREAEVIYPDLEAEIEPEPVPEIHPTVCLTSFHGQTRGELRYMGNEGFVDIMLKDGSARIGYGKEADISINRETISQFHARIHKEEDGFYIEDLNSTNGTFVNEEPLVYKEQRKLAYNDIVQFADIRYRFC
ncbi:MAG: FHA domain-containing protein [Lachnobacterium sp.]|nr:FHA domain-containing protein [Lachnobacterium sp.]